MGREVSENYTATNGKPAGLQALGDDVVKRLFFLQALPASRVDSSISLYSCDSELQLTK